MLKMLYDSYRTSIFCYAQAPWNSVRYELIGEPTTLQFFGVDFSTGGLYVKRDLRTTTITTFIAVISATDGGGRTSTPNAYRTISVQHNNFSPQFTGGSCDRTVTTAGVGTVVRVQATDGDRGE